jgi:hypothetical protein
VTGGLPTVPLGGEDKSTGLGNGDHEDNFGISSCSGVLWSTAAEGIINGTGRKSLKENRPHSCGINEVASTNSCPIIVFCF